MIQYDIFENVEIRNAYDWRNYVPEEIQLLWDTFNQEQKDAIQNWAEDIAGQFMERK